MDNVFSSKYFRLKILDVIFSVSILFLVVSHNEVQQSLHLILLPLLIVFIWGHLLFAKGFACRKKWVRGVVEFLNVITILMVSNYALRSDEIDTAVAVLTTTSLLCTMLYWIFSCSRWYAGSRYIFFNAMTLGIFLCTSIVFLIDSEPFFAFITVIMGLIISPIVGRLLSKQMLFDRDVKIVERLYSGALLITVGAVSFNLLNSEAINVDTVVTSILFMLVLYLIYLTATQAFLRKITRDFIQQFRWIIILCAFLFGLIIMLGAFSGLLDNDSTHLNQYVIAIFILYSSIGAGAVLYQFQKGRRKGFVATFFSGFVATLFALLFFVEDVTIYSLLLITCIATYVLYGFTKNRIN
jgi:hypothetical protein